MPVSVPSTVPLISLCRSTTKSPSEPVLCAINAACVPSISIPLLVVLAGFRLAGYLPEHHLAGLSGCREGPVRPGTPQRGSVAA